MILLLILTHVGCIRSSEIAPQLETQGCISHGEAEQLLSLLSGTLLNTTDGTSGSTDWLTSLTDTRPPVKLTSPTGTMNDAFVSTDWRRSCLMRVGMSNKCVLFLATKTKCTARKTC